MHAHLVIAVVQLAERERVVVVLGVIGVYGKSERVAEIAPALELLRTDGVGDEVGGGLHLLVEAVRQIELGEYRVHLGVVLPRLAQHVDYVPVRADILAVPAVHDCRHLHPGGGPEACGLLRVDLYVIRHRAALHQHPGLRAHAVQDADEGLAGALHYLDHLALAALLLTFALFSGDRNPHRVAVQRVSGPGRLHEYVFLLSFNQHKDKSLSGHLDLPGILREFLAAGLTPASMS